MKADGDMVPLHLLARTLRKKFFFIYGLKLSLFALKLKYKMTQFQATKIMFVPSHLQNSVLRKTK